MQAMHLRAKAAGMYEYGASPEQVTLTRTRTRTRTLTLTRTLVRRLAPEQMHYVPHVPPGSPAIENNWQQAWRAIKVPGVSKSVSPSVSQ